MKSYTLRKAIDCYGLKPGDIITVYIESAGTKVSGIYNNPIPTLDMGSGSIFPLREDDLVIKLNGENL